MAREDPNMPVGAAAMLRMVPNVPLALPLVCRMSALDTKTHRPCVRLVRAQCNTINAGLMFHCERLQTRVVCPL